MESGSARQGDRFLDLLQPEDRDAVWAGAGRRRFRRGAALIHEGTVAEEVLILVSGRVKVSSGTREGKEIILRFCGPGDLIGEMAVVEGEARSASVEAIEPVEAIALPATRFRRLLETRPGIALALLRAMSRRFRDADRKRVEFAAAQTLGRVAARITELAERYGEVTGDGIAIDLRLSQEELAGWTGSSREAVVKVLHTLRELGLISTERRRITVLDLEGLRRQAA